MNKGMLWLGVLLVAALLSGCAASGMKDVQKAGFLSDYSMMTPGGHDRAALLYTGARRTGHRPGHRQ